MDKPTLIAAISLFVTILNSIYLFISNYKRINIILNFNFQNEYNFVFLKLTIENKSRLPIALSNMTLSVDDKVYYTSPNKMVVTWSKIPLTKGFEAKQVDYSLTLPQNLPGLFALGGDFGIEKLSPNDLVTAKKVVLKLYTNRGIVKKDLTNSIKR